MFDEKYFTERHNIIHRKKMRDLLAKESLYKEEKARIIGIHDGYTTCLEDIEREFKRESKEEPRKEGDGE